MTSNFAQPTHIH